MKRASALLLTGSLLVLLGVTLKGRHMDYWSLFIAVGGILELIALVLFIRMLPGRKNNIQ